MADRYALRTQINRGEMLIGAGRMVGDREDHRFWKLRRDRWRTETLEILGGTVEPPVLHTFERALSGPPSEGELSEDMPVELEGLRRAVAVLIGLRDTSQPDPGG